MKKAFLLIVCLHFSITNVLAQTSVKNDKKNRRLILSPGISLQKSLFAEINLMLINQDYAKESEDDKSGFSIAIGPRIGIEINTEKNNRIIAPKIGYEISGVIFCFRTNMIYYIQNATRDLRFLPEIGLSYGAFANITIGYGFPFFKEQIDDVTRGNLRLTFNLSKAIWQNRLFK